MLMMSDCQICRFKRADFHGLDRIVSIFDAIDLDELCRVREQQLVHDLELVFGRLYRDERGHRGGI